MAARGGPVAACEASAVPPGLVADLLVEPEWLAQHIADPNLRVIDASWYLPDAGRDARAEYAAGHVPGAIYLDLSTDLADLAAPVRNTMASPRELAARFAAHGIGSDHSVVVYDRLAGYSAGRVWLGLRLAGHDDARILDGGFVRWEREGRAVTRDVPRFAPATFGAKPRPELLVSKDEVLRALASGSHQIVDARGAARFRGEGAEPAARKGHIPGSINVPHDRNLAGDPLRLRTPADLARVYAECGLEAGRPIITTCGSGVTASLALFALALQGRDDVAVYDGSWAEWGNDADTPVATGEPRPRGGATGTHAGGEGSS